MWFHEYTLSPAKHLVSRAHAPRRYYQGVENRGEPRSRGDSAGRGGHGLSRGVEGTDARGPSAGLGADAEQPRDCAEGVWASGTARLEEAVMASGGVEEWNHWLRRPTTTSSDGQTDRSESLRTPRVHCGGLSKRSEGGTFETSYLLSRQTTGGIGDRRFRKCPPLLARIFMRCAGASVAAANSELSDHVKDHFGESCDPVGRPPCDFIREGR